MPSDKSNAKIVFQTYTKRFFIHSLSVGLNIPKADVYVVIPVYAEEFFVETLDSLNQTLNFQIEVCLVLVVNSKVGDSEAIRNLADENLEQAFEFQFSSDRIQKVIIDARNLDGKNVGVGLARKIGMDAVIISNRDDGFNPWLVCLDADCQVSKQYFTAIENKLVHSNAQVAVFGISHSLSQIENEKLKSGILQYELFLEYYRLGLKLAGFPFFYHTIGSSMATTAMAYAKSGGMNQRKAGEDFYFLHKLFPNYVFKEISEPLVFPSARISERVPFGTGRFQMKWVESGFSKWPTYAPEIFELMRVFIRESISYLTDDKKEGPGFNEFLSSHEKALGWLEVSLATDKIKISKKASPIFNNRKRAFFQFFDGFMALKFVHYFQPYFSQIEVEIAIESLLPECSNILSITEKVAFVRKYLSTEPSSG
ncbi:MAG TPA: glycosyltransferase family A protein [Catalimonadaceae bacterium]|nr:glycosyltransferase family A protein [Catalimonadaceae bacterium]